MLLQNNPPLQSSKKGYIKACRVVPFGGYRKANRLGDAIQGIPVVWCCVGNITNIGSCLVGARIKPLGWTGTGPKVPISYLNGSTSCYTARLVWAQWRDQVALPGVLPPWTLLRVGSGVCVRKFDNHVFNKERKSAELTLMNQVLIYVFIYYCHLFIYLFFYSRGGRPNARLNKRKMSKILFIQMFEEARRASVSLQRCPSWKILSCRKE